MYLKKLEMLGFKSFADRTELLFQPGMTAIVGPNGCGKSNVVDAFKWIFGEQSAKGMRGSEMKDVIFNGTLERKPTGFAEVTIIFENSDRFLDVDYSEVAITRRLFRSGESEYLINKQRCRLKDIRELFMGTGVGQTSYSILEQGKIDALLQANNVERRFIFEEAAGISKYLSKKAETLRALLRVEENLTRLNDIIAEVEKRLQRVKAQASKARRYRELSERLKDLRVRSAIEDYRESVMARADLSFQLHWSQFRLASLEGLLCDLSAALERRVAERAAYGESLRDVREKLAGERMLAERTLERIEQERRRGVELLEEGERKSEDLESTTAALRQLREGLEAERKELEALRRDIGARGADVERLQVGVEGARRGRERLDASLREGKEAVVELLQKRSRLANGIVQIETETGNLLGQRERLQGSMAGFRTHVTTEEAREAALRGEMENLHAETSRLETARSALEASACNVQTALEDLERELQEKVGVLLERRSRYDALKSLEESLEGVSLGVADILRRWETDPSLARVHGMHGMVGSLLKVESKYARAVEAALGVHAQSLVVEGQDGALGLLELARAESTGALEVISLDRVDFVTPEHFPRQAGVLGPLLERVEVPDELEDLFQRLLANVVLVEDFDTALALSRNGLRPFRLVTLDGEAIEPWGGISRTGKNDLGIISRRSEMDDLLKDVAALEAEEGTLRERQAALKRDLGLKRDEIERLREESSAVSRGTLQAEGNLAQIAREKGRLEREIAVGTAELSEIQAQIEVRSAEKAVLDAQAAQADRERQAAEEGIRAIEADVARAAGEETAAVEALTQGRLQLAQAEKREEGLREMIARGETNLAERESHTADLRDEIQALAQRQRESVESLAESQRELAGITAREEETRKRLEAGEARDGELKELEQTFRKEVENVHQESARVQREREAVQLRDQEERHRRNSVIERMDEEYGLDLAKLLDSEATVLPPPAFSMPAGCDTAAAELAGAAGPPAGAAPSGASPGGPAAEVAAERKYLEPDPGWDRERAREEIREAQEKLRRMGSVNLEALDELDELDERHRFQLAQRNDLVESAKNLQGIIGEINRTSRDLFLKTFEEVQTHFSDLFRKCFGGGKAELVLEEGLDVLEAGIDIVAKPPGKKITSLSLMSGGEKTMTTIALLFAIFRAKPGPFCILDEVDAPLDETNVRRFVVLLQDFLAHTQFIVVTHNKVSMGEANTLYGITMQEHGVSKRVSVELESYDPEKLEVGSGSTLDVSR